MAGWKGLQPACCNRAPNLPFPLHSPAYNFARVGLTFVVGWIYSAVYYQVMGAHGCAAATIWGLTTLCRAAVQE